MSHSPACSPLPAGIGQTLAAAAAWLALGALAPAGGAIQSVAGFLLLICCGRPGAIGISLAHCALIAPGHDPIAFILLAAAPGVGAGAGFTFALRALGVSAGLIGLRRMHLPVLAMSTGLGALVCRSLARDEAVLVLAADMAFGLVSILVALLVLQLCLATLRAIRFTGK